MAWLLVACSVSWQLIPSSDLYPLILGCGSISIWILHQIITIQLIDFKNELDKNQEFQSTLNFICASLSSFHFSRIAHRRIFSLIIKHKILSQRPAPDMTLLLRYCTHVQVYVDLMYCWPMELSTNCQDRFLRWSIYHIISLLQLLIRYYKV